MKLIKKASIFAFVALNIFSLNVSLAMAGLGDMSPTGAMNEIIEDLGINKSEMKYSIKTSNVSRRKKQQPQVSLAFDPVNPANGRKVTAVASPIYFNNDYKDLYFTWYLKLKGCDEDKNPGAETKEKCDMDGNGEITVRDWKIKAARIIVNSGFDWQKENYSSDADNDGYQARMGGDDQLRKSNHCFIHDIESGNEYEMKSGADPEGEDLCEHLFPNAPGNTTGDDSFGKDEESFWHTNPNDPDTAQAGNKDEANIAGLGVNSFSWTYEYGDEVGVVVEGVSNEAAQEADSSYRIMWALLKNNCQEELLKHTRVKNTDYANYFFTDMRPSDIDNCLERNLIDPANEGGQSAEKIDISLSHVPEFPMNDPQANSDEGDELVIHSSLVDSYNPGYLNYTWQVYQSDEANPESWGNPLLKEELKDSTQTTGLGLSTFKFKLNFPNPKKYLKVRLTVLENSGTNTTRQGHADVVIPVSSTSERIKVYGTDVSLSGSTPVLSLASTEICNQGMDKAVCPVVKDKIVGLKADGNGLTDFLWTVNGEPISYKECFFDGCQLDKQGNVIFFPVLENTGFEYNVALAATNQKTGQKINITRTFKVSDPEIKIVSAEEDTCVPVLLGYYVDLDGKFWPDYSKTDFTALVEKPITLKAVSNNFETGYNWFVDGNLITKDNAGSHGYSFDGSNNLVLAGKIFGERYTVSASAFYSPDSLTRKALNKFWGVPLSDFYESQTSATIKINVVGSISGYASANTGMREKIFASVYSAAPGYLIFLLKIVITTFLMLFTARFILSFFPNLNQNE